MVLEANTVDLLLAYGQTDVNGSVAEQHSHINSTFVIEIIRSVNILYQFKNIIMYITRQETTSTFAFLEAFWREFTTVPYIILTGGDPEQYLMDGFLSTPSLCVIFTSGVDDPIMEFASDSLTAIRYFKTLFIFEPVGGYADSALGQIDLLAAYSWIWREQFLNTILVTLDNSVYLYDPYPTPNLIQRVNTVDSSEYFTDRSHNMDGMVVEGPMFFDLPRVFRAERRLANGTRVPKMSGVAGKLFLEYLRYVNATFRPLNRTVGYQSANNAYVNSLLESGKLDIAVNARTTMTNNPNTAYPIGINDWCIMVPHQNRTPDSHFITNSLQHSTWLGVTCAVLYISFVVWFCTSDRPRDFSAAFLTAICALLCIVPTKLICSPTRRMRFIYVALFLFGFILSNLYVSRMASLLTTTIPHHQIDTVYDVIQAKIRVKVLDYEYDILLSRPQEYPKEFMEYVDIVDRDFLNAHRTPLNVSYAYSTQTDRWVFLNFQQKHLAHPIFRMSKICMGPFFLQFPMRQDSHFKNGFQYFVLYASQFGYFKYWLESSFADALAMKHVQMLKPEDALQPLSLNFFQSLWMFWWLGLTVAGAAFVLEVKWQRVKQCHRLIVRYIETHWD